MAARLILHIGHYKTGTTALQVFCARNDTRLGAAGVEYPDLYRHHAKHSIFAFALLQAAGASTLMHGYANRTPPEALWATLLDHVRRSPAPAVLVSSEEFMRLAVFPAAEEELAAILARHAAGIEIEAIAYLRPPQAHLRSWYNQLIKMGQVVPDYLTALCHTVEPIHLDYGFALAPWRRLLGDGRVILRPYRSPAQGRESIFDDFFRALGLKLPGNLVYPGGDPNPRLDERVAELVRMLQNEGHPPRVVKRLRDAALASLDPPVDAVKLDDLRRRVAAGVAALSGMPRSELDIGALQSDLPQAPAARSDSTILAVVLSELQTLRRRLDRLGPLQIADRLARLEALVGVAEPEPQDAAPGGAAARADSAGDKTPDRGQAAAAQAHGARSHDA